MGLRFCLSRYSGDTCLELLGGAAGKAGQASLEMYHLFYSMQEELSLQAAAAIPDSPSKTPATFLHPGSRFKVL